MFLVAVDYLGTEFRFSCERGTSKHSASVDIGQQNWHGRLFELPKRDL